PRPAPPQRGWNPGPSGVERGVRWPPLPGIPLIQEDRGERGCGPLRERAAGSGALGTGARLAVALAAVFGRTRTGASVTNGGKTTLAKNLQKHLPNCSVISQDDFFKPESEIETDKNGFLQYDVLEALNMEKMMSVISCWMESATLSVVSTDRESAEEIPILIIEGFLLFNYNTRVYEPPDSPGYFDGHVWPMYLKHRQEMQDITWEVVYLDGTKSEEDLFLQVYEDLIQELAKQKCLQVTA
uniref:Nicotinamide riboside kinase 1 n=1 Tax=Piliocolobus tephrosceles TaxID=591936 RepID=A0A8C9IY68_9PRIM